MLQLKPSTSQTAAADGSIHAVASCQITVDEVKAGQVRHSFSYLLRKLQQLTSSKHLPPSTHTHTCMLLAIRGY